MSTTLETYTDTDAPTHDRAKRAIADELANYHRGRDESISSTDLSYVTKYAGCAVSASTVRDLIPQIRREFGLPIASGKGYYVAETADEAAQFIERQKRQAEQSLRTAREFAAQWNGSDS